MCTGPRSFPAFDLGSLFCMFQWGGSCQAHLKFCQGLGRPPNHTATLNPSSKRALASRGVFSVTFSAFAGGEFAARQPLRCNSSTGFSPARPHSSVCSFFQSNKDRNKLVHMKYGNMLSLHWEGDELKSKVHLSLEKLLPEPTRTYSPENTPTPLIEQAYWQCLVVRRHLHSSPFFYPSLSIITTPGSHRLHRAPPTPPALNARARGVELNAKMTRVRFFSIAKSIVSLTLEFVNLVEFIPENHEPRHSEAFSVVPANYPMAG